jgi:predicted PurR-regulated permease PerM
MRNDSESSKSVDFNKLINVAYMFGVLCAFVWAKEFLLPVILAALISFLLTPVVARLERWGLHPVLAVFSVAAVAFAVIGALCATMSTQALDLLNSLPKYRDNIHAKWAAIQQGPPGPLNPAFRNLGSLINDLGRVTASGEATEHLEPTKVQIVGGPQTALAVIGNSVVPVFGPVGEFAVVVVLVVFMLLERKRLRNRFLRLIGHSRLATTTLAIDESGSRLSGFLLGQLLVNTAFAIVLVLGLSLIGIPNAILWGILTLMLRFLPYVGLWISAFFPLVLSVAISTTWKEPILTLGLYGCLELFTNNLVEPFVLGGSTGMSPLSVIVSALFWTWLWGPIGLLLATPLTASLVVLGRYFSAFHVCSVLLAADPPTPSETKFIRLLTENRLSEARVLIHEVTTRELSTKTAEEFILPVVRTIENELFPGGAANQTKSRIYREMQELIEQLNVPPPCNSKELLSQPGPQDLELVIVPLVGEGDEVVGRILGRLLEVEGIGSTLLPSKTLRAEKIERLKELDAKCVVLSAVESRAALAVSKMARFIRSLLPNAVVVIGLWSLPPEGAARLMRRIRESSVQSVYTSLEEAVRGISALPSPQRAE